MRDPAFVGLQTRGIAFPNVDQLKFFLLLNILRDFRLRQKYPHLLVFIPVYNLGHKGRQRAF